jgi:hypothetical protein
MKPPFPNRRWAAVLIPRFRKGGSIFALLFLLVGCQPSKPAGTEESSRRPQAPPAKQEATTAGLRPSPPTDWDWSDEGQLLGQREFWDVNYLAGNKVGYEHTIIEERLRGGQKLVRIRQRQVLSLKRFSETLEASMELESWQNVEGQLLAFRGQQKQGLLPLEFTGQVVGDRLIVRQRSAGREDTLEIPWKNTYRGLRAVEDSLARQPMQPGEKRRLQFLLPSFNVIATAELEAADYQPVQLLTGTHELLKIDMRLSAPGGFEINGILWTDRSGEILKSFTDLMHLEVYRSTREQALAATEQISLDLGEDVRVPVVGRLERPNETRKVRYRVTMDGGDPARLFVVGMGQQVQVGPPGQAEVTVYALRPGQSMPPEETLSNDPPQEGDLAPNSYIQSDNPEIIAFAENVTRNLHDPWEIAVALERAVYEYISDSNYRVGFASAAEVFQSRQGDCTEHAVLLAALARARKIPARVAMGLVYSPNNAFYYHMWTEVYINGIWYPLDSTLGRGGIAADHLKMAVSNLQGAGALAGVIPILRALGKLKIEVVEVQY